METSFTGVLVRREYKPGQEYVQLIFKSAHDTKVAISRNVQIMKSLSIGGKYRLIGKEYTIGSKTFIRDPKTLQLSAPRRSRRKLFAGMASVSVCFVMIGSFVAVRTFSQSASVLGKPSLTEVKADNTTTSAAATADPVPETPTPAADTDITRTPASNTSRTSNTPAATATPDTTPAPETTTPAATPVEDPPAQDPVTEPDPPTDPDPELPPIEEIPTP